MKSLAHDVMLESVSVLHYEAHLFLRVFLTYNNRRKMMGVWEKVCTFVAEISPLQLKGYVCRSSLV
jgi:hypothetical protein